MPDAGLVIGLGRNPTDAATGAPPVLADQPTSPVVTTGTGPPVVRGRQGTNLTALVAASLTKPCQQFNRPSADLAQLPATRLIRPSLPTPATTAGRPLPSPAVVFQTAGHSNPLGVTAIAAPTSGGGCDCP